MHVTHCTFTLDQRNNPPDTRRPNHHKNLEVDQHFELLAVTDDVVFALSVVSLVLAL